MNYEFSAEQNKTFESLRAKMLHVVILYVIIAVLQILLFSFGPNSSSGDFPLLILAILHLILAFVFYRPLDNFQKVITTQGNDIEETLQAIKDMNVAFLVAIGLMIFNVLAAGARIAQLMP